MDTAAAAVDKTDPTAAAVDKTDPTAAAVDIALGIHPAAALAGMSTLP